MFVYCTFAGNTSSSYDVYSGIPRLTKVYFEVTRALEKSDLRPYFTFTMIAASPWSCGHNADV